MKNIFFSICTIFLFIVMVCGVYYTIPKTLDGEPIKYGDKVIITSGFYEGSIGHVVGIKPFGIVYIQEHTHYSKEHFWMYRLERIKE